MLDTLDNLAPFTSYICMVRRLLPYDSWLSGIFSADYEKDALMITSKLEKLEDFSIRMLERSRNPCSKIFEFGYLAGGTIRIFESSKIIFGVRTQCETPTKRTTFPRLVQCDSNSIDE